MARLRPSELRSVGGFIAILRRRFDYRCRLAEYALASDSSSQRMQNNTPHTAIAAPAYCTIREKCMRCITRPRLIPVRCKKIVARMKPKAYVTAELDAAISEPWA